MNIDPSKLRGPLTFDKFINESGWCSSSFFGLSTVLIEMLAARGIQFAFSRIGPILIKEDGTRLFLMTTGYVPAQGSGMTIDGNSANYMHAIGMDRVPFFQVHCSEQEKLAEFALTQFADLFEQTPLTDEERNKMTAAITTGNTQGATNV